MPRNLIFIPSMSGIRMSKGYRQRQGRGIGSVLLSKGGPGSASSYESTDDYLDTTGRTLGKGLGLGLGCGLGMNRSGLNSKLESLSMLPKQPKSKNIRFNL